MGFSNSTTSPKSGSGSGSGGSVDISFSAFLGERKNLLARSLAALRARFACFSKNKSTEKTCEGMATRQTSRIIDANQKAIVAHITTMTAQASESYSFRRPGRLMAVPEKRLLSKQMPARLMRIALLSSTASAVL